MAVFGRTQPCIAQVGAAIGQMDQATQQNAALVEEAAAATEQLREQARLLAREVGTFRLEQRPQERLALAG